MPNRSVYCTECGKYEVYFPNYSDCFRDLALPQVTDMIRKMCVYEIGKHVEGGQYGVSTSWMFVIKSSSSLFVFFFQNNPGVKSDISCCSNKSDLMRTADWQRCPLSDQIQRCGRVSSQVFCWNELTDWLIVYRWQLFKFRSSNVLQSCSVCVTMAVEFYIQQ